MKPIILFRLEIGGSNDIANLFREAAETGAGFHEKDLVENYLHQKICTGELVWISLKKVSPTIGEPSTTVYDRRDQQSNRPLAGVKACKSRFKKCSLARKLFEAILHTSFLCNTLKIIATIGLKCREHATMTRLFLRQGLILLINCSHADPKSARSYVCSQ